MIFATTNEGKIREVTAMGEQHGFSIVPQRMFGDIPEVFEDQPTYVGNAVKKASQTAAWLAACGHTCPKWVFAEDSGLEIEALNGRPGLFSGRYSGAGPKANNRKVIAELQNLGLEESPAKYVCVVALVSIQNEKFIPISFYGECQAIFRSQAQGTNGFAYDTHMWLDDRHTVADLSVSAKLRISHRGQAFEKMFKFLEESSL